MAARTRVYFADVGTKTNKTALYSAMNPAKSVVSRMKLAQNGESADGSRRTAGV
jgi:hypothetical protein